MILVISNMYPSEKYPNYGVFVKNFYDQLSTSEDSNIIFIKKEPKKILKFLNYLQFYYKVFMEYAFGDYDLVYVHYAGYNAPPVLLAKILNKKIKLIVNVHGSDVTPEKKLERATNFLTNLLLKKSDLIVVPSSYFASIVNEKYAISNPVFVSPSGGIDFTVFTSQSMRKKGKNKVFKIGYVSRIDKEKGWDTVLYALERLIYQYASEVQLIMVGNGAQNDQALKLIKELKLENHVTKHNLLTHQELVSIYSELDVFIFPSTRAGESLGLVGIEAMACGTPVIGSDAGGIKTYLKDGINGFLFNPGSVSDLIQKIEKYKNLSSEEKKIFSENAIATAKRFDSKKVNEDLIKAISEKR